MMTTPTNGSDAAIRRALEILAGMTGGFNPIDGGGGESPGGSGNGPGGEGSIGNGPPPATYPGSPSTGARSTSGTGASAGASGGMPPQLEALMNMMLMRMQYQEPLFRSVTQQALLGLPKYAQMRDVPVT